LSRNLGALTSWNPLGHSRPVTGLLYLYLLPIHKLKTIRKINKFTISDFIDKLSCESWDSVFNSEDANAMFNSFLNIYLIFNSSFPLKKVIVMYI